MSNWETKAIASIKKHEGCVLKMYKCPAGKNTIGYGHNLDAKAISQEAADVILDQDFKDVASNALDIFGQEKFNSLHDDAKVVVTDMIFNLGSAGFKNFKKMIACLVRYDYKQAAMEGRDSKWYKQVTSRAEELMRMLEAI